MSSITISGSNFDDVTRAIDHINSLTAGVTPNRNQTQSNSYSNENRNDYNQGSSSSRQQNRNYNEPKSFSNDAPQPQDDFVAIDWQAAARESVIIHLFSVKTTN